MTEGDDRLIGAPVAPSAPAPAASPAPTTVHPISVPIPSHGAAMAGTMWVGVGQAPRHTVLLFPGFANRGDEVLGLGASLSAGGINVVAFTPRGWHDSEGEFTAAGAIADAGAAFDWLLDDAVVRRYGVDTTRISVGGFSFGAATVLAFAAREPRVRRVFAIAAPDHYVMSQNPAVRALLTEALSDVWAPDGPIRPAAPGDGDDRGGLWREFTERPETFSLPRLAPALSDRSILLISALNDGETWLPQLEHMHLPLYRALRAEGAADVSFLFMDEHDFALSRPALAEVLLGWLRACEAGTPCGGNSPPSARRASR